MSETDDQRANAHLTRSGEANAAAARSHEDEVLRKDRRALVLAGALAEGLPRLNDTALEVLCAGDAGLLHLWDGGSDEARGHGRWVRWWRLSEWVNGSNVACGK